MKWIFVIVGSFTVGVALAEDSLLIRTNVYAVSGATPREIRSSIDQKRPWKDPLDASTSWSIKWSFTTVSTDSDCKLGTLEIKTSIAITVPQWDPTSEAEDRLKQRWQLYKVALLAHEDGHKRIALAAAKEIKTRLKKLKPASTCAQLEAAINRTANKVIEEFRQREKAYDERTNHGRAEGAVFP